MSDDEGSNGGRDGFGDDDLSLPKATVFKIISEYLPDDVTCSKETRDLLLECCIEFINLISSESNEICERGAKKTIAPEHVVQALKDLGFEVFIKDVQDVLQDHKKLVKDRERKSTRMESSGLSQEELIRQQEELFAASKARYEATNPDGVLPGGGAGSGSTAA
ncbi:negative cofactor 2 transcription regulator complex subunit ncb2 [Tilletia horrida]|uniref:Negative cofactor 2 transcription regulator complex subunit ncb2 n=1 Tax=Tilletia horrida TaxID=155126 RepID=A0AAN6JMW6_9BASI|nr:negative cofactor 2 transcription regulator complex subunit ncb2 [Tilletia horrida]KAK0539117.1 negative cofactor 2 transcription regulator complex subunit ncb2 [Tilletia horrida]KAK0540249.1 negative cofactor 2 transcription regulator complex subunit ncb2 [Tilletia horrida]KAK0563844.1 negative cofactor 2 transcription regulator complex subunit ncb2 [Tilletia horrida]